MTKLCVIKRSVTNLAVKDSNLCVCESLCVINLCVTKRCDKFVCARLCVTKLCVCVKDCVVTKRMRRGGGGGGHGGGGLDTEPETRTPHKCCGE